MLAYNTLLHTSKILYAVIKDEVHELIIAHKLSGNYYERSLDISTFTASVELHTNFFFCVFCKVDD